MSTSASLKVQFNEGEKEVCLDCHYHGFAAGVHALDLIDKFNLPLISGKWALPEWRRDITFDEMKMITGGTTLREAIKNNHFLKHMLLWRSKPPRGDLPLGYGQAVRTITFLKRLERGEVPKRIRLEVWDMG